MVALAEKLLDQIEREEYLFYSIMRMAKASPKKFGRSRTPCPHYKVYKSKSSRIKRLKSEDSVCPAKRKRKPPTKSKAKIANLV